MKAQVPLALLPAIPSVQRRCSSSRPRSLPAAVAAPNGPNRLVECQPTFLKGRKPGTFLGAPPAATRNEASYPAAIAVMRSLPLAPTAAAVHTAAGTTTDPA